jgi:D-glycero-D-manno-heptose 1,7-bisphosphate phosphatase
MRPAVFLDRDGVLNAALLDEKGRPLPPRLPSEFRIPTDVPGACADLRAAGFALVCVTNQPDIARGTADRGFVDWANGEIAVACGLEGVFVCPHDDIDRCDCRKPKPGLILQGAKAFDLDLTRSFMVGDRYRDIEAGKAAGLQTILLDFGYPERAPTQPPDFVTTTFSRATTWILRHASYERPTISRIRTRS